MKEFEHILPKIWTALWTAALALAITSLLSPFVAPVASPLFLIAVMVSAWRGGLLAGLSATFLSAATDLFFFLPPNFSFVVQREKEFQTAKAADRQIRLELVGFKPEYKISNTLNRQFVYSEETAESVEIKTVLVNRTSRRKHFELVKNLIKRTKKNEITA